MRSGMRRGEWIFDHGKAEDGKRKKKSGKWEMGHDQ